MGKLFCKSCEVSRSRPVVLARTAFWTACHIFTCQMVTFYSDTWMNVPRLEVTKWFFFLSIICKTTLVTKTKVRPKAFTRLLVMTIGLSGVQFCTSVIIRVITMWMWLVDLNYISLNVIGLLNSPTTNCWITNCPITPWQRISGK